MSNSPSTAEYFLLIPPNQGRVVLSWDVVVIYPAEDAGSGQGRGLIDPVQIRVGHVTDHKSPVDLVGLLRDVVQERRLA